MIISMGTYFQIVCQLPHLSHYSGISMTKFNLTFKRGAVCISCESLYIFDECLKKNGTETTIVPC